MGLRRIDAEQQLAIKWLSLPKKGGKTFEEIADLCGVHPNTLYNWRRDPLFEKELKREIVRSTIDKLPEVMASIPDHIIKEGNAAMLKTFLQTHDMLTDRVEVTQNSEDGKDIDAIKARLERYKKAKSTTEE
jgi:hypothetical protein